MINDTARWYSKKTALESLVKYKGAKLLPSDWGLMLEIKMSWLIVATNTRPALFSLLAIWNNCPEDKNAVKINLIIRETFQVLALF